MNKTSVTKILCILIVPFTAGDFMIRWNYPYVFNVMKEIIEKSEKVIISTNRKELLSPEGSNRYGDTTIYADKIAEGVALKILKQKFDKFLLLSEELGLVETGNVLIGDPVFVLDPLDGSTNFKRSIPYYSISLGYTEFSETLKLSNIKIGIVKELSGARRFYHAIMGKGAWLNQKHPLKPSQVTELSKAVVEVNPVMTGKTEIVDALVPLLKNVYDIRRLGSAALTTCNVADGTIDAAVDIRKKLRIVDVAAAYLIAKEAGVAYYVKDYPITLETRVNFVIASTQDLLRSILSLI